jgi:NAD(P)-dependent dehydrogenase (short-subunit alcohol dehydrogenase family)
MSAVASVRRSGERSEQATRLAPIPRQERRAQRVRPERNFTVGHLDGKAIAITGSGRGIGRAVALLCAAEGASVVINDYGVTMDGNEPQSDVADAVVAEITAAGGNAVANANSVTTMEGGASIVQSAVDSFGRIDGVVCVAGILRERMLFNMSEAEWDPVIETHLKGTFTVFRAAAPIFRSQKSGSMIGFTSGAFAASVAQANYSAAKGGIVSLVRSAAAGMNKYGVTANCIAPVAKSRMSGQVPFGLEMGEPEDVAPMVAFLLGEQSRHVTGQVYTANGGRLAVWNQPVEVREIRTEGRWTPDGIAARFEELGQEPLPILERLAAMAEAAASSDKPNQ